MRIIGLIIGLIIGYLLFFCMGFAGVIFFFIMLVDLFSGDFSEAGTDLLATVIFAVFWIIGCLLMDKCGNKAKEKKVKPSVRISDTPEKVVHPRNVDDADEEFMNLLKKNNQE